MTATAPRFVIKGWHVLVGLIVFFGVDIGVNAYFMVSAYRTFPGETVLTPYEDGLAYNTNLVRKQAQAALGWRLSAGVDGAGLLRVDAADKTGAPLDGLKVQVRLTRPATAVGEHTLVLKAVGRGVYTAMVGALKGAWDLNVSVSNPKGEMAQADRRVVGS